MCILKFNLCGHANPLLTKEGFIDLPIQVDLGDLELETKLVKFFQEQGVKTNSVVTIVAPGLAPLALSVMVVLHGMTGQFPNIQLLIRNRDGLFELGPTKDMHIIRNQVARLNRPAMISI